MLTPSTFADLALSFPGTEPTPHFNRTGFRPLGKRMFATHLAADNTATVFLSPAEQQVFCAADPSHIHPVPGKWGKPVPLPSTLIMYRPIGYAKPWHRRTTTQCNRGRSATDERWMVDTASWCPRNNALIIEGVVRSGL